MTDDNSLQATPIRIGSRVSFVLFAFSVASIWLAGTLGSWLVVHLWPGLAERFMAGYMGRTAIIATTVTGVFVSPLIETAILLYTLHIARQAIDRKWLALLVGTAPVVLIHVMAGWQVIIVAMLPFLLQSLLIDQLRRQHSTWQIFLFISLVHGCANAVTIVLNLLFATA